MMASRASLPSDPEFLLGLMDNLPIESDSDDDDFDGYLGEDDERAALREDDSYPDHHCSTSRASVRDEELLQEPPLVDSSLSPTPMQGAYASGSPLSPAHSLSPPDPSNSTSSSQQRITQVSSTGL